MPGFVIGGNVEPVLGASLVTTNYFDNPALRLKLGEDCGPRQGSWVHLIVLHTTSGFPKDPGDPQQTIKPGNGPNTKAAQRINSIVWQKDHRCAGSHLLVDHDGSVAQLADLKTEAAYHAGPVNHGSIGIEIYDGAGEVALYEEQLNAVVRLVDWLTRRFQIQRAIPMPYAGKTVDRLTRGGVDVVGVVAHREIADTRGRGDAGDAVFDKLAAAGYERFDLAMAVDRATWLMRQKNAGIANADGVPGPKTCATFMTQGKPHGLWINRPGD